VELSVKTTTKRQIIDITNELASHVPTGLNGLATVTILHTAAAITTADLDPGTDLDLLDALDLLLPKRAWRHPHNPAHAPDHLLSSIIGPSVSVPVVNGQLILGTWQRIILVELDGPRDRKLILTLLSGSQEPSPL
jgi:secondary thiamine-phosphate synthase enzyme